LIELLVVIAIIGILASVVLASLNSARTKGADAAVKSNMANIRAQAELWYDNNSNKYNTGTATTTCSTGVFADPNIVAAVAQITTQSVAPACYTNTAGDKWAMSTTLKSGTTWCVDNSGWAKAGTAGATGVCA
jgi:Tfp pilus assembly protein PilE